MSLYDNLDRYVKESRPRFEEWLGRLVEIPTVSMDPARRNDMRRGAAGAGEDPPAPGAQGAVLETRGPPPGGGGGGGESAGADRAVFQPLRMEPSRGAAM